MTLEERINDCGFIFSTSNFDVEILKEALATEGTTPSEKVKTYFLNFFKRQDPKIKSIECVYEDIRYSMYHEMHTHLVPARYQIVVWFPEAKFEGREFVFGTKKHLKKITPSYGDYCFMKTNDLKYIHGVTPLETDILVRTMLISVDHAGKLGEHVTVSSDTFATI